MAGPTWEGADRGDSRDDDLDAQWAELTARLGELRLPPEQPSAPSPPDAQRADHPLAPGPRDYSPGPHTEDEPDAGRDLVDGFHPPDPDPLDQAEPVLVLGWVAVLAGVAVILLSVFTWRTAPGVVWLVASAAVAVGVGVLLWRMPARREPDDDDGAVV